MLATLRSPPGVRARGPTLPDAAVAAAVLVGSAVVASAAPAGRFAHSGWGALDPPGMALVALSSAPVACWRRAPLGVFVLTAAASAALAGLGHGAGLPIGAAVALYLLAASRDEAAPWTGRATSVVVGMFIAYVAAAVSARAAFPGIDVLHTGLAWAVAWFAGERTRLRRGQLAELRGRATAAEREAERERRLAVAEERARIARDLHDAAGHAINVIAVRAGAARLRHDPEGADRSLAALEAIEALARQTAGEIDQFVGALREGSSPVGTVEAPPSLASVGALVAQHAATGLEVTLDTAGVPRTMTGGAEQAAFRILQEALTNAARHGTGDARVELAFGDEALEVVVTNRVPPGAPARTAGGHGLIGMRERATLLGGDVAVDRSGGAFRVRARLPYGGGGR